MNGPGARPRPYVQVRGRSFMALVLSPEAPLANWLGELDAQLARSPSFFEERLVVVDLSGLAAATPGLADLLPQLRARGIRVIGVEGLAEGVAGFEGWVLPASATGARPGRLLELPDEAPPEPTSLLIDVPVRSGQSIVFPNGDVTVLGSVASGAEVMAGGSIHVYGALRGRAVAGMSPAPAAGGARIFCRKLEAELLAISGLYRTADELDPGLRGRPAQAWLSGETMMVAALD